MDNYVPAGYNSFYDLREQGIVADYVIMMGYDEHFAGGEAGSVSSINYVKNGIAGMLENVPREKLIGGVPFYTRLWTEAGDGTITSKAMGIAEEKDGWIIIRWSSPGRQILPSIMARCRQVMALSSSGWKRSGL